MESKHKLLLKSKYDSLPIQVKASVWFFICSFLQKGISTITTPIFTRLLSTAEYGQYSVFNSWLGIITIFVTMQLSAGVYSQGIIKFDNERNVFSSSLQGLTVTLIAVWLGVYLLFHDFFNSLFSLTTTQMVAMFAMIWTTAVFGFWAVEQRSRYSYKHMVAVTLIASVAKPLIGIVFVYFATDKVTARIIGLALVEMICFSPLFFIQLRKGAKFFHAQFWKYALLFNLPLIPHYLSQVVLSSADRIMIERMCGASEAGIYSLAYSVSLIMTLVNTALNQTIGFWIFQKIKSGMAKSISHVSYATLVIVAAANILLIALAPEVIAFFAPKNYHDAIWVIPPIAMSAFFMFMYDLFARFEFYFEKRNFIMVASSVAAIVNILLNYIFIRIFGYYAAGYTTLFCYIAYTSGHYYFMRRICKRYLNNEKVYSLRVLLAISGGFILLGFIFMLTYRMAVIRYLLILAIMVVGLMNRKRITEIMKAYKKS